MHETVSAKQLEIADVCRRHRVQRLNVFGSAARAGDFEPGRSDADFLVDFHGGSTFERIFDLTDDLEAVLGVPVHLITRKALQASDKPHIQADIVADLELVHEE